jgi:hypothetical protein
VILELKLLVIIYIWRRKSLEIQSPEIGKVTVWLKMEGKSLDFFKLDMEAKEVLHFKTIKIYLDKYKKICYY